MKISWGYKIILLYACFVALVVTMVVASTKQHFDLVSDTYYAEEIKYQDVIDAGKNQAQLSGPITIGQNDGSIILLFPEELKGSVVSGTIHFYSPVNAAWDRQFPVETAGNVVTVPRSKLQSKRYIVKIDLESGKKKYHQETDLNLN